MPRLQIHCTYNFYFSAMHTLVMLSLHIQVWHFLTAPVYLTELLTVYKTNLPATPFFWYFHLLSSLCAHTLTWSEIFFLMLHHLWNSLPCQIRSSNTLTSFKSALKSPLYKLSYWLYVCVCLCACMHACSQKFVLTVFCSLLCNGLCAPILEK